MVDEQKLEHRLLRPLHAVVGGMDDHAFGDPRVAGDLQLRDLLDLDEAHAAVAGDRQSGMPAVVRHLDAEPLGGADDGEAVFALGFPAVDGDLGHAQ